MNSMESTRLLSSPRAVSQLLALVRRVYETVPFYQAMLPGSMLHSPSLQLTDLPILTKEQARASQEQLVNPSAIHAPDVMLDYTSGSTGIPLRLVRRRTEIIRGACSLWRARMAIFPDVMNARGVQVSASAAIASESIADKTIVFSAFDLRPDRVESYLDEIDHYQPAWLRGHPAILAMLAEGLKRTNRHLRSRLAFIESNSGWLSPETRTLLEEVFHCRVANHYGTRETYTIAYECRAGNMHVLDESVVAEILECPQAGERELIVSSLVFETMPFIRYRVGDIVQTSNDASCSCGKRAPALLLTGGRSNDLIVGTTLLGTYVFHVIVTRLAKANINHILQYQVQQTDRHTFHVLLVLKDPLMLDAVATKFRAEAVGILPEARFFFEAVDYIEPIKGGKVQAFVRCI